VAQRGPSVPDGRDDAFNELFIVSDTGPLMRFEFIAPHGGLHALTAGRFHRDLNHNAERSAPCRRGGPVYVTSRRRLIRPLRSHCTATPIRRRTGLTPASATAVGDVGRSSHPSGASSSHRRSPWGAGAPRSRAPLFRRTRSRRRALRVSGLLRWSRVSTHRLQSPGSRVPQRSFRASGPLSRSDGLVLVCWWTLDAPAAPTVVAAERRRSDPVVGKRRLVRLALWTGRHGDSWNGQ